MQYRLSQLVVVSYWLDSYSESEIQFQMKKLIINISYSSKNIEVNKS